MTRETASQIVNVVMEGILDKQYGVAKHWDFIVAYSNGADIQVKTYNKGWIDTDDPDFGEEDSFRLKPKPPKHWRADYGKTYWCVKLLTSYHCNVYEDKDYRHGIHARCYERGNYFENKKDAQMVAGYINKIFSLLRDGVPASDIEVKQIEK